MDSILLFGKAYRIVCLAVFIFLVPPSWAIDSYSKIAQERPEDLDLSRSVSSSGRFFTTAYELGQDCAPLNEIHSWVLTLMAKDGLPLVGAEIDFIADMPEHLHGMVTKPAVSESGTPGEYVVEGVKFHMPGWWEITLDVSRGRGRDLARFNVLVGEGYCHD